MIFFAVMLNFRTLWRQHRLYRRMVYLNAVKIYAKKRKVKKYAAQREQVTREYLQKHYLSFFEWVRKVGAYGQ